MVGNPHTATPSIPLAPLRSAKGVDSSLRSE